MGKIFKKSDKELIELLIKVAQKLGGQDDVQKVDRIRQ